MEKLADIIKSFLNGNEDSFSDGLGIYEHGYFCGYHDALVDVMLAMGIETDEEWYD